MLIMFVLYLAPWEFATTCIDDLAISSPLCGDIVPRDVVPERNGGEALPWGGCPSGKHIVPVF